MESPPFASFVFVDFENVPKLDLGAFGGHPVHVTLLLGKHQKTFGLEFLRATQALGDRLELVEVGASGHNALDITLAFYLGQAARQSPRAQFVVISRDKDFDAMIAHVRAKGIDVTRHEGLATVPFLAPVPSAPRRRPAAAEAKAPADRLTKFIAHVRNSPPSTRAKLESMISHFFKPSLPKGGARGVIAELVQRGIIAIDAANRVNCP